MPADQCGQQVQCTELLWALVQRLFGLMPWAILGTVPFHSDLIELFRVCLWLDSELPWETCWIQPVAHRDQRPSKHNGADLYLGFLLGAGPQHAMIASTYLAPIVPIVSNCIWVMLPATFRCNIREDGLMLSFKLECSQRSSRDLQSLWLYIWAFLLI